MRPSLRKLAEDTRWKLFDVFYETVWPAVGLIVLVGALMVWVLYKLDAYAQTRCTTQGGTVHTERVYIPMYTRMGDVMVATGGSYHTKWHCDHGTQP